MSRIKKSDSSQLELTYERTNELTCLAVICFLVGCTMNLNRSQAMAPMQKDDMKMGKFWAAFKNLHRNSEKKGKSKRTHESTQVEEDGEDQFLLSVGLALPSDG